MRSSWRARIRLCKLLKQSFRKLRAALRLERIKRFGKQSEKLSDLQLELLVGEPGVSSEEIAGESSAARCRNSLQTIRESTSPTTKQQGARRTHPGRNELPSASEAREKIIACAPEQCTCGSAPREQGHRLRADRVVIHEAAGVLCDCAMREKRACTDCKEQGVPRRRAARIAPKSIFADETNIEFILRKYADSLPCSSNRPFAGVTPASMWR